MNTQVLINLAKEKPNRFYVEENDYVVDKETGTLLMINPLDDYITGSITKENVRYYKVEIERLIAHNLIEPEVLDKFNNKYCK